MVSRVRLPMPQIRIPIDHAQLGTIGLYANGKLMEEFEHEFVFMGIWLSKADDITLSPNHAISRVKTTKPDGSEDWLELSALPGDTITIQFHVTVSYV